MINETDAYLQSSPQAMLYDEGDAPGIASNQLPVYAEVNEGHERGAKKASAIATTLTSLIPQRTPSTDHDKTFYRAW